eukprot:9366452-Pyramimonas_sp.AAC.1
MGSKDRDASAMHRRCIGDDGVEKHGLHPHRAASSMHRRRGAILRPHPRPHPGGPDSGSEVRETKQLEPLSANAALAKAYDCLLEKLEKC